MLLTGEVDIKGAIMFAKRRGIKVVIEVKTVDALVESVKRIAVF